MYRRHDRDPSADTESGNQIDQNSPHPTPARPVKINAPIIALSIGAALLAGFLIGWFAFGYYSDNVEELPSLYDENQVQRIFKNASRAVVEIRTIVQSGRRVGEGSGSGFFIDNEGHIITNNHVVDGATTINVRLYDGQVIPAQTLGSSPQDDLALIKIDPSSVGDLTSLPLGESKSVTVGQLAIAIGSPFFNLNSISVGVVSGIGRSRPSNPGQRGGSRPIPNMVQTDAALNPGNSGGPLLTSSGEVIGVNSSVQVQSGMQIGVGFAIPSDTVINLLDELKVPVVYQRPWIGFAGDDIEDILLNRSRIGAEAGIYVRGVCGRSPASLGGLRGDPVSLTTNLITGRGDIINGIDGNPVLTMSDLVLVLNDYEPGDSISLAVVRNGQPKNLTITLGSWRSDCMYINQ